MPGKNYSQKSEEISCFAAQDRLYGKPEASFDAGPSWRSKNIYI
jgi:hypothetical protein